MFSRGILRALLILGAIAFLSPAAMLQPAEAAQQIKPVETLAERPVIKKFGNWNTRCEQFASKPDTKRCHVFVDVRLGERKERILYLGVGYMPGGKPNNVFVFAVTPLGSLLPGGFRMAVDQKTKLAGPFLFCAPSGCQAELILTAAQLAALQNGKDLDVTFQLIEQGEVKIPMKLNGFKQAFASIPKLVSAKPTVSPKP